MSETKPGVRFQKSATKATDHHTTYLDLLEIFVPGGLAAGLAVFLKENDTNAVHYKVDGTIDGTTWIAIKAETAIAKNGSTELLPSAESKLKDPWLKLRVQIKSQVEATHGNVTVTITG